MEFKNHVQLVGRLGSDPIVRETKNGKVARFSIATNEQYSENGQVKNNTQWHNIVAWNRVAEKVERYFHKGDEILVEGKLTSHSYEDQNKIKRYVTEVVANEAYCLNKQEKSDAA